MSRMLDEALRLAELGFSIIWLKKRSKRPLESDWTGRDTATPKTLSRTYRDGYNVGVRLGEPSRLGKMYLHVVDMDVRDPDYADDARQMMIELFGIRLRNYPSVISGSGGESRHFYLLSSKPFPARKLWHSKESFVGEDGKKHWCAEIEFFGTGKQVALPPSIHPDTGKPYRWESEFAIEDCPVISADKIADLVGYDEEGEGVDNAEPLDLTFEEAEEYLSRVQDWADDRDTWLRVGMALKHEFGDKDGWQLFDDWSKKGKGYDRAGNRAQWRGLKNKRHAIVTMRSIVAEARDREIIDLLSDEAEEDEELRDLFEDLPPEPKREKREKPADHLTTIPGVLGEIVDYYNRYSIVEHPELAVSTALALGSVVLGRHWSTPTNNFTSLFIVNVAETGTGKEYGFRLIERFLREAGWDEPLVGKPRYTSDAAIIGELMTRPRHISLTDEVGIYWGAANKAGNSLQDEARATLMELWGRCDGVQREKGYSTKGMSKEQLDAANQRRIVFPALTMFGATTPGSFYEALSMKMVVNGFLNRILIIHSKREPSRKRLLKQPAAPKRLIRWIKDYVRPIDTGDDDTDFDLSALRNPVIEPVVEELDFTKRARAELDRIEDAQIAEMKRLKLYGFSEFYSRAHEMAMRISLIVALSCESDVIDHTHVKWAGDFVLHHMKRTVGLLIQNMDRTPIDDIADRIAEMVKASGPDGVSQREVWKHVFGVRQLSKYQREEEIPERLLYEHSIVLHEVKKEGRGRKAKVFIEAKRLRKTDHE